MTSMRHDVTPNPERIAEGLRDTGYVFETAVADVVDNSIAAGATKIHISLQLDVRGKAQFSVADNGIGMDQPGLLNALRYGADQREDPSSLGKFGLGLKTASTAFARRLMVTSRVEDGSAISAVWDLDDVAVHGWKIEVLDSDDSEVAILEAVAPGSSGTVVRWQKVDRLLRDYNTPTGMAARKAMQKRADALGDHIALIFHRFLDAKDDRAETVSIAVNGVAVEAYNPFGFGADKLADKSVQVQVSEHDKAAMTLRVFVLPRREELSSSLGEPEAKRARLSNKTQGIYTYRENRLIHGPDWLGIYSQEPHFTLCRAELSFDHLLDTAFQVDIKKSTIVLDPVLIAVIKGVVDPVRREAEDRYREGRRQVSDAKQKDPLHGPSNTVIGEKSGSIPSATLGEIDKAEGTATITNTHGPIQVDYAPSPEGQVFVDAVESLPEGLLYKPAYIGENPGVQISKSHPYYEKVYLPSRTSGVTVQALDSLLWALASAEFRSAQDSTKRMFEDIRYDVSKALRRLVEDLPDPDDDAE